MIQKQELPLLLFARISRVRRWHSQNASLHAGLAGTAYDEQRELEMRSITSLHMNKRVRRCMQSKKETEFYGV